jgi:hypothetical protein
MSVTQEVPGQAMAQPFYAMLKKQLLYRHLGQRITQPRGDRLNSWRAGHDNQ